MGIAFALTVLTFVATAASAQAPSPCNVPDALLDTGFTEDAKAAYLQVLSSIESDTADDAREAMERCAAAGLARSHAKLVAAHVAVADLYRKADDKTNAASAYAEALKLSPASVEATAGMGLLHEESGPDPIRWTV